MDEGGRNENRGEIGEEKSREWIQDEEITSNLCRFETKSWPTQAKEKPPSTVENFECTISDFSLTLTKTFHIHIRQIIIKVPINFTHSSSLENTVNSMSVKIDRALTDSHSVYLGKIKYCIGSTKTETKIKRLDHKTCLPCECAAIPCKWSLIRGLPYFPFFSDKSTFFKLQ